MSNWKTCIPGYEASSDGRIRNAKTGNLIKQYPHKDGYLRIQIAGKTHTVHRIIASTFLPNTDNKPEINHIDGIKTNNAVSNLEWCTRSENQKHAYRMGLKSSTGINNPRCKLAEADVREIKRLHSLGPPHFNCKQLAAKYKVAPQTIYAVTSGQNWDK